MNSIKKTKATSFMLEDSPVTPSTSEMASLTKRLNNRAASNLDYANNNELSARREHI